MASDAEIKGLIKQEVKSLATYLESEDYDNALSDANKDAYRMIISCYLVDLATDSSIKTKLWNMFGEGTTTRENLEALLKPPHVEE